MEFEERIWKVDFINYHCIILKMLFLLLTGKVSLELSEGVSIALLIMALIIKQWA